MAAPASTSDPDLEQVAWDLSHLLEDPSADPAATVGAMLTSSREKAEAFAERHRGRIASLDASGLAGAMREAEAIEDAVGRAYTYASLSFATNTADPPRGALLQKVSEQATG